MGKEQKIIEEMGKVLNSWQEIVTLWGQLEPEQVKELELETNYPFQKAFEDLFFDFYAWTQRVENAVEGRKYFEVLDNAVKDEHGEVLWFDRHQEVKDFCTDKGWELHKDIFVYSHVEEEDVSYYSNGFSIVNRIGYFLSPINRVFGYRVPIEKLTNKKESLAKYLGLNVEDISGENNDLTFTASKGVYHVVSEDNYDEDIVVVAPDNRDNGNEFYDYIIFQAKAPDYEYRKAETLTKYRYPDDEMWLSELSTIEEAERWLGKWIRELVTDPNHQFCVYYKESGNLHRLASFNTQAEFEAACKYVAGHWG